MKKKESGRIIAKLTDYCAVTKKQKKILGWKPRYIGKDGLKDGIKIFYDWLKLNKDKYFNMLEFYE